MLFQVAVTVQSILKFYTAFAPIFDGFLIFLLLFLIFNFALSSVSKPQTAGGVIGGLLGGHGKENHSKAISAILALMITIPAIARGYSLLVFWDKGWIPSFIALMAAFLLFGYLRSKHQGMNFWLQFGICAVVAFVIFHAPLGFTSFDLGPFWGLLVIIGGIAAVYYALHLRGVSAPVAAAQTRSAAASAAASAASDAQKAVQSIPADVDKVINALRNTESATDDEDYTKKAKFAISAIDDILKSEDRPLKKVGAVYDNAIKLLTSDDIDVEIKDGQDWTNYVVQKVRAFDAAPKKALIDSANAAVRLLSESGSRSKAQLSNLSGVIGSELPVLKRFTEEIMPLFNTLKVISNDLKTTSSKSNLKNYVRTLERLKELCVNYGMHEGNLKEVLLGLKLISDNWVKAAKEFEKEQNRINEEILKLTPPKVSPATQRPAGTAAAGRMRRSGKQAGATEEPVETFEVTFTVRDEQSGAPLRSAEIVINSESFKTNEKGECVIPLQEGNYGFNIKRTGFRTLSDSIPVSEATRKTYRLTRSKPGDVARLGTLIKPAAVSSATVPLDVDERMPRAGELGFLRDFIASLVFIEKFEVYEFEGKNVVKDSEGLVEDIKRAVDDARVGKGVISPFGFTLIDDFFRIVGGDFQDAQVQANIVLALSDFNNNFRTPFSNKVRNVYDILLDYANKLNELVSALNVLSEFDKYELSDIGDAVQKLEENEVILKGFLSKNFSLFNEIFASVKTALEKQASGESDDLKKVLSEFKPAEWGRLLLNPYATVPKISMFTKVKHTAGLVAGAVTNIFKLATGSNTSNIKTVDEAIAALTPSIFEKKDVFWETELSTAFRVLLKNKDDINKLLGDRFAVYNSELNEVIADFRFYLFAKTKNKDAVTDKETNLRLSLAKFENSHWGLKLAEVRRWKGTAVGGVPVIAVSEAFEKLNPDILDAPNWSSDLTSIFTAIARDKDDLKMILGDEQFKVFKQRFDTLVSSFKAYKTAKNNLDEAQQLDNMETILRALRNAYDSSWRSKFLESGPVKTVIRPEADTVQSLLKLFESLDVLFNKLSDKYLNHARDQIIRLFSLFNDFIREPTKATGVQAFKNELETYEEKILELEKAIGSSQNAAQAKSAYSKFSDDKTGTKKKILSLLRAMKAAQ